MDLGWILLGIVGWILAILFTLVLMRMAGDRDGEGRRQEGHFYPHSDETITRSGAA
ncbi:MAG TPA: hypothetical protein VF147_03600 [Vicinamibacterales bacterium]